MTPTDLAAKLAAEATALGWTATTGVGYHDGSDAWMEGSSVWLALEKKVADDLFVTIAFNLVAVEGGDAWARRRAVDGVQVEAHTVYNGRCFTRRGVDCASCQIVPAVEYSHDYVDLASLLDGETARCRAAADRVARSEKVPEIWFLVTPEKKTEVAALLKSGKPYAFTPSGFGVGYRLSTKRGRFARQGSDALASFFGVSKVFVESLDCD